MKPETFSKISKILRIIVAEEVKQATKPLLTEIKLLKEQLANSKPLLSEGSMSDNYNGNRQSPTITNFPDSFGPNLKNLAKMVQPDPNNYSQLEEDVSNIFGVTSPLIEDTSSPIIGGGYDIPDFSAKLAAIEDRAQKYRQG